MKVKIDYKLLANRLDRMNIKIIDLHERTKINKWLIWRVLKWQDHFTKRQMVIIINNLNCYHDWVAKHERDVYLNINNFILWEID